MTDERLRYLFDRYTSKLCTLGERRELAMLCLLPENQAALEQILATAWEQTPQTEDMPAEKGDLILRDILHSSLPVVQSAKVRWIGWRRIAVAASILFAIALGSYFLFQHKEASRGAIVKTTVPGDVLPPVTNRAMITLADGSMVYLDSATNGQLALQDNIKLVKLANGQIAYETAGSDKPVRLTYNTLTNPRGSKVIDMILSDGSHVWLNAGSSLKYPVAFVGNERRVEITGEAYFEVAHNAQKPFYVTKGAMEVKVLGTHFNVNAYEDEQDIRVTLLEGSVEVASRESGVRSQDLPGSNLSQKVRIKPGEQAVVTLSPGERASLTTDRSPDIDQVMAWKNGRFELNSGVQAIMKQIARWYDVDIEYRGDVMNKKFGGTLSREQNVLSVLNYLEQTGSIHFKLEGRKVIVMP